jgi:hypothetical protein
MGTKLGIKLGRIGHNPPRKVNRNNHLWPSVLFGLQHSLMARGGFKRWLARKFPEGLERATYVHASNLTLWPVLLFWQTIPIVLLDLSSVRPLMTGIYWMGWLIVLLSSLNIDLLELWGLRQAWSWARGEVY